MRIMVTGASGYLGQVIQRVLAREHEVAAYGHRQVAAHRQPLDLREAAAVTAAVERLQPDAVVHCAAYRDPDFCEQHPAEAWRLNVESARALLASLPAAARFLFISSDYVFDGVHPPYPEDGERHPINYYGRTKVAAEDLVLARGNGIVLRVPLLVGPGPRFQQSGFIAKAAQTIEEQAVSEWDDVIQRFPTAIDDVAAAVAFLLEREDTAGIYHFSQRTGGTQYAWVQRLADIMGVPRARLQPARSLVARPARRPMNSQLANRRLAALGFDRQTDFETVARQVLATRCP